jgi:hypothetical protein
MKTEGLKLEGKTARKRRKKNRNKQVMAHNAGVIVLRGIFPVFIPLLSAFFLPPL